MSVRPFAERVIGFVAAEADVAVLLRSGPGKRTLMLRWDLDTDEFEAGQWLFAWVKTGAISPDGRLFAYDADKPMYAPRLFFPPHNTYRYSVVCQPPFFSALAFWGDRPEADRKVDARWARQADRTTAQGFGVRGISLAPRL